MAGLETGLKELEGYMPVRIWIVLKHSCRPPIPKTVPVGQALQFIGFLLFFPAIHWQSRDGGCFAQWLYWTEVYQMLEATIVPRYHKLWLIPGPSLQGSPVAANSRAKAGVKLENDDWRY